MCCLTVPLCLRNNISVYGLVGARRDIKRTVGKGNKAKQDDVIGQILPEALIFGTVRYLCCQRHSKLNTNVLVATQRSACLNRGWRSDCSSCTSRRRSLLLVRTLSFDRLGLCPVLCTYIAKYLTGRPGEKERHAHSPLGPRVSVALSLLRLDVLPLLCSFDHSLLLVYCSLSALNYRCDRPIIAELKDTDGCGRPVTTGLKDTDGCSRPVTTEMKDTDGSDRAITTELKDTDGCSYTWLLFGRGADVAMDE